MKDDDNIVRIDSLLKHISLILDDTKNIDVEKLNQKSVLFRATCFSISQVGEMMIQLEKHLINSYPDLPWKSARKMRNIIVHDYGNTDIDQVSSTIKYDLPLLKESFIKIREELISKLGK